MTTYRLRSALRTAGLALVLPAGGVCLAGCAGPVNAAGSWSLNLTNGANECMVMDWTPGQMTTGVPVSIVQSGSTVTADVTGAYGTVLDLYYGTHRFTGTVAADHIEMSLVGRAGAMGTCAYTPVLTLDGTISGDTITGTVAWSFDTNSSAECGAYATCANVQAMNGSRPPTSP